MTETEKHLQPGNILQLHFHTGEPLTGCLVETTALGALVYLGSRQGKGREVSLVPWGSIRHLQSTGMRTLALGEDIGLLGPDMERLLQTSQREREAMDAG